MDVVTAESLATKFREGYEASLHLLWAKLELPTSLIMNMEAEKSEEDARQSLGQLRSFGFVWGQSPMRTVTHCTVSPRVAFAIDARDHM